MIYFQVGLKLMGLVPSDLAQPKESINGITDGRKLAFLSLRSAGGAIYFQSYTWLASKFIF